MANWHYDRGGGSVGPVSREDLKALLDSGAVDWNTLVWNDEQGGEWKKLKDFEGFKINSVPPPLPTEAISDTWVWLIALWPIAGAVLELLFSDINGKSQFGSVVAFYFLPYVLMVVMDRRSIKASGRSDRTVNGGWALLIPVYLFKRSSRLDKPKTSFWVWCVAFVAALFGAETVASNIYLGSGTPTCAAAITKGQITQLFDQIAKNEDVTSISIEDIRETSFANQVRSCSARVLGSDTERYLATYTITPKDGQYYFELQIDG